MPPDWHYDCPPELLARDAAPEVSDDWTMHLWLSPGDSMKFDEALGQVYQPYWVFNSTPRKVGAGLEPSTPLPSPPWGWGLYVDEGFRISWSAIVSLIVLALGGIFLAIGLSSKYHSLQHLATASIVLSLVPFGATLWITARKDNNVMRRCCAGIL